MGRRTTRGGHQEWAWPPFPAAESTSLLPHLCLGLSLLQQDRKTFPQGSSGSVTFLFSTDCFHVQTPPSRPSTHQPQCQGRACRPARRRGGGAGLLASPRLRTSCAGKSQGLRRFRLSLLYSCQTNPKLADGSGGGTLRFTSSTSLSRISLPKASLQGPPGPWGDMTCEWQSRPRTPTRPATPDFPPQSA